MKRAMHMIAALAVLMAAASMSAPISAAQEDSGVRVKKGKATNNLYIVQMIESPVVDYKGDVAGMQATKPARGQKIDPSSSPVVAYAAYLDRRHNDALSAIGGGHKVRDYHYTFNGFAAEITAAQAEAIKRVGGVVTVSKDELRAADTSSTPAFLGLTAPGGLWAQLGGVGRAGEDIIIGDVDSGIWPEHPSFANDLDHHYNVLRGWSGICQAGEQFTASMCNGKLIGARYYNSGFGGNAGIDADLPWEFNSARDYNGHGTHTASTAGGNNGVPPTGPAAALGPISGMAPRARIAVYKALWSLQDGSQASGFTSDLVAAIDQAVADGVDVINYSISGTLTNFLDPVEVSFLFAADAGVFVASSAGNSGPTASTVAHPSPWITTVAAGTHNRNGEGSVTIAGVTYPGASFATAVTGTLVDASQSAVAGGNADFARLCFAASDNGGAAVLDPAKIAGKIVLCDRGTNALVNKSLAVAQAGGIGMVLTNVAGGATTTLALIHSVPTVHVPYTAANYAALHAAAQAGQTASIAQAKIVFNVPAPFTASFSSRGPLRAGNGDLLKPDVIAPGQDILAAVAPPGNGGLLFSLYSGTSMSSPHVAGLAMLLKNLHPEWTPMMIKSALMTSAGDVLDGPNTNPTVIFSQGAGHVAPNKAADPGLIYNSGLNEWLAFLCGTTTGVNPSTCNSLAGSGYSLDPSDLNVASIAIGDLPGVQTVKRTVINIGSSNAQYNVSVAAPSGINVVVNPTSMRLAPGQSKTFTVSFTRTTATLNAYTGGQLTWSDGTHKVRIPLVVRPVALAAPPEVFSTGGAINYQVKFGYTGPFTATPRGLVPGATNTASIAQDPDQNFSPTDPVGQVSFPVVIPAGTTYARFSLFNANVSPASDLDLYVLNSSGALVGASGGGTSAEEVNLLNPAAGNYTVYVHGFGVPAGGATFTLFNWVLGTANAGNMTVTAPASATLGTTGNINLTFNGLASGTKYLGSVAYSGSTGLPNPTIVRVDP